MMMMLSSIAFATNLSTCCPLESKVGIRNKASCLNFIYFFTALDRSILFGSRRSPFHYISNCLGKLKAAHEGLHFLRSAKEVSRYSLIHVLLQLMCLFFP